MKHLLPALSLATSLVAQAAEPVKLDIQADGPGRAEPAIARQIYGQFAEHLGAEVYLNANLGSGTVQEMAEWLEYMGDTALARERRANGRMDAVTHHQYSLPTADWKVQDGWNRKGLISETGQRKQAFYVMAEHYKALPR